jgi:phenylalanyl-tRNA synthetase beta chain
MKFTLGWLKEYLDTDASLEEITDTLTAIGLEVEGLEDPAADFAAFKVAYVETAEKHPDADKLQVLSVDTGEEKLQIVCGASNARAGIKGILAPIGSYVPGLEMTMKKGNIRGIDSHGMMAALNEMGLEEESAGIIEVDDKYDIGTPFADVFGLNDPVIEINLTPNRGDCAAIYGIARDLAAAGLGTLKPIDDAPVKGSFKSDIDVSLKTPDTNPHFVGRTIKGVKNGPSPDWLQARLKAVGLRPISALVDITNFMTLAYGRPLHVYDAKLVKGNIYSRLSKKGEELDALNDKSYTLEDGMTAICDDSGVLGLGGIVGGTSTGCEADTTDVFVESAYFDPMAIARTGRDLQITSDARYRFERGVDPEFTKTGMEIATKMILELCGGEASEIVEAGAPVEWKREIEFNPAYTEKLAGLSVPEAKQKEILETLGFTVDGKSITPPSWRGDVEGKADIVEEVVRIVGFDALPTTPVRSAGAVTAPAEILPVTRTRLARGVLAARGLSECVTWSFLSKDIAGQFGSNDNALTLSNPISSDLDQMRPSIIPNLVMAASRNADKGFDRSTLFEVGPVFETVKPDGQKLVAAGVRYGAVAAKHWSGAETSRNNDVLDAKADAMAVLETLGFPATNMQINRNASDYYHPGRSGTFQMGKFVVAQFGELHPATLEELDIEAPVVAFEVFLDALPAPKRKGTTKPQLTLSAFQPVSRDFAFIVDENVEADAIIRAAKSTDRALITAVDVFDVYQGKGVEDGKKSVAIAVTMQPVKATMTDTEIDGLSQKIISAVTAKTGGTLRS